MEEDKEQFAKEHGASWVAFINSKMWKDARAIMEKNYAIRKVVGATPAEIVAFGVVFAANIQGQQDVLNEIEGMCPQLGGGGADIQETYSPENDHSPEQKKQIPKTRNRKK